MAMLPPLEQRPQGLRGLLLEDALIRQGGPGAVMLKTMRIRRMAVSSVRCVGRKVYQEAGRRTKNLTGLHQRHFRLWVALRDHLPAGWHKSDMLRNVVGNHPEPGDDFADVLRRLATCPRIEKRPRGRGVEYRYSAPWKV